MIADQQDLERSGPHLSILQHRWGAHQASGPSGSVQTEPIIINGFSSCMVFVVVFVRSGSRCAAKWSFIHSWQTWQSHVGREGWGARPLVLDNLTAGLPLLSGGPLCCCFRLFSRACFYAYRMLSTRHDSHDIAASHASHQDTPEFINLATCFLSASSYVSTCNRVGVDKGVLSAALVANPHTSAPNNHFKIESCRRIVTV